AMSTSSTSRPCSTKGISSASATSQRWQPRVPKSWHSGSIRRVSGNDQRLSLTLPSGGDRGLLRQPLQTVEQALVEVARLVQHLLAEARVEREAAVEQLLQGLPAILGEAVGAAQRLEQAARIVGQTVVHRAGGLAALLRHR